MPTATAFFGQVVTNLGPLTTTYTAPSSCATNGVNILQEYRTPGHRKANNFGLVDGKCTFESWGDYIPSAKAYDDTVAAYTDSPQGFIPIYSPGLYCPSGWTTAGTAVGSSKPTGSSVHDTPANASGIFTQDPWPYPQSSDIDAPAAPLPLVKALLDVIDGSETVIWCCPK